MYDYKWAYWDYSSSLVKCLLHWGGGGVGVQNLIIASIEMKVMEFPEESLKSDDLYHGKCGTIKESPDKNFCHFT